MTENPTASAPDPLVGMFKNPPAVFRGKPFWSWNGALDSDELRRQARVFSDMGMGGFFMHSRTGLKTEYLGDEWFECINACADEAAQLGLEPWLYDEDRWPSGSAGGLATADPRFRMKVLRLRILDAADFTWPADVVAVFIARLDAVAFTDSARLQPGEAVPDDGRSVLLFTIEAWAGHSFYNGQTYLDTLSREATDHFLKITHERYAERCGDRLGSLIRGIFTDEPHHGTVMCENNENRAMTDQRWTTPWTEKLWAEFEKAWGYDLRAHLPELFLFPAARRISRVKWQYMELLQRMFLEHWAAPLHDWCRAHSLQLTGHILHEDSLVAQAVPGGSAMRYYEHLDVPGVDVLALHNRNFWIVKQLASAARQLGKKWLLSELYGCTGWQLDFAGHKRIGAWQALLGINVRCHHLAWATMQGEAKRDYPASIGFQSAWSGKYRIVEDYFARLHILLQRGSPVCDILVLNPVETMWAQIHPGWAQWLGALDPHLENLEQIYRDIFTWLTSAQLDFDYGDEDHLARFARIERRQDGSLLHVGHAKYRAVIVAGAETIRGTTLDLLGEFHAAGGTLIFAGKPPAHIDAIASESATSLASHAIAIPLDESAVIRAARKSNASPLLIAPSESGSPRELLAQLRRDCDTLILALLNTSETTAQTGLRIRLADTSGAVEEWDCATGERFLQPAESTGEALEWRTDLPPLGERLFLIRPASSLDPRPEDSLVGWYFCSSERPELPEQTRFEGPFACELLGPFHYELDEPNICVLDFAEYQLGDGDWRPAEEILKLDEIVRAELGFEQRGGTMLQPWARPPADPAAGVPLRLRCRFHIAHLPPADTELLMETPHLFQASLNACEVAPAQDPAWFIDPCFKRIPLPPGALRVGENELILSLTFTPETDLEAIYLIGNFGVSLATEIPNLTALPDLLQPTCITTQGLPFYSGKITYRLPLPAAAHTLDLGAFGGAVAQLRAPAEPDGPIIAWPPFAAEIPAAARAAGLVLCDIWLTRRNTFGPLHLTPLDQPFIGPQSFRSTGSAFSRPPILHPAGILQAPTAS